MVAVVAALAVLFTFALPASADPLRAGDVRLEMRTARTDCGAARYAWVGRHHGRPLLMLNGTGSPASEWDPALLARLGRERRLLVFDYPGLGRSMSLPRTSFNLLARCAAKLVRAVHRGPVDVLGWSMGGFVAQRMAVQSPRLVRRLVLVATNPGGRPAVLGPKWVQREDSDPGPALKAYVRTNYPKGYRDLGWAFIRRLDNAEQSRRYPRSRVPAKVFRAMVDAEEPWLKSSRNSRDLRQLHDPRAGHCRSGRRRDSAGQRAPDCRAHRGLETGRRAARGPFGAVLLPEPLSPTGHLLPRLNRIGPRQ